MDRKDLKIQALLERVSSLATQYENQAADMRVELTVKAEEHRQVVAELQDRIAELEAKVPSNDETQGDSATE